MIYLDNSATTALCPEAIAAMRQVMEDIYGNPSSLHAVGLEAEKIVTAARSDVLAALGVRGEGRQLIFCGSGSEANNLALIGTYTAKRRRAGARVILTAGEHSSVEAAAEYLASLGADVVRLSTKDGALDMDEAAAALTENTVLVSSMLVNNETGALYPVADLFRLAKAKCPDVICHCDAVQGFLKVPVSPRALGADLITVSAHKIHGPKGTAALYVSPEVLKRRALVPLIHGGQQENGLRAGTENVIGIAGFGAAAAVGAAHFAADRETLDMLGAYLLDRLAADEALREIHVNRPVSAVPHIISLALPDIKSETMLHFLSGKGICVSSGSACSSHAKKVSRALSAYGLSDHAADCTIRVSLAHTNSKEDLDALCAALGAGLSALIRIR
mgnify:FL=1